MKTAVLFGITLLAVAPATAQSTAPAVAAQANNSVTLTGCVGGGINSAPIMLSQAMVIPGTQQPGQPDQTPSAIPPQVSSDPTQPPPAAAPITPSPTGTSGSKTPSPAGTSGVAKGTAPAGSSASSLTGYRLSGADMKPWLGQRVQVIGAFVPVSATAPMPGLTGTAGVTGGAATPPLFEFKVETVKPASGSCPK